MPTETHDDAIRRLLRARIEQGLPEKVTDPTTLRKLAYLIAPERKEQAA